MKQLKYKPNLYRVHDTLIVLYSVQSKNTTLNQCLPIVVKERRLTVRLYHDNMLLWVVSGYRLLVQWKHQKLSVKPLYREIADWEHDLRNIDMRSGAGRGSLIWLMLKFPPAACLVFTNNNITSFICKQLISLLDIVNLCKYCIYLKIKYCRIF